MITWSYNYEVFGDIFKKLSFIYYWFRCIYPTFFYTDMSTYPYSVKSLCCFCTHHSMVTIFLSCLLYLRTMLYQVFHATPYLGNCEFKNWFHKKLWVQKLCWVAYQLKKWEFIIFPCSGLSTAVGNLFEWSVNNLI